MTSENTPEITPKVVEDEITAFVNRMFADLFARPEAMTVARAWMSGDVAFVLTNDSLFLAPAEDGEPTTAADRPTVTEPDDRPTPGMYL